MNSMLGGGRGGGGNRKLLGGAAEITAIESGLLKLPDIFHSLCFSYEMREHMIKNQTIHKEY